MIKHFALIIIYGKSITAQMIYRKLFNATHTTTQATPRRRYWYDKMAKVFVDWWWWQPLVAVIMSTMVKWKPSIPQNGNNFKKEDKKTRRYFMRSLCISSIWIRQQSGKAKKKSRVNEKNGRKPPHTKMRRTPRIDEVVEENQSISKEKRLLIWNCWSANGLHRQQY